MSERKFNRRGFFLEGLRELVQRVQKAAEPIAQAAKQFAALEEQSQPKPAPPPPPVYASQPHRDWLRPPGAVPEQQFRDSCSRCGECVRVCPVQCIRLDYGGEYGHGVPYIEPDEIACILCDGLTCTHSCPSNSILPLASKGEVAMGLAHWHETMCLRSTCQPCTICVDRCPIGAEAIRIVDNRIEIGSPGCTGCGVCQHECPTLPKSLTILPKSATMQ